MVKDFLVQLKIDALIIPLARNMLFLIKGLKKLSIMPFNTPLPLSTPKVPE